MKKISIGLLILYCALILFFQIFSSCMSFRLNEKELNESFKNQLIKPKQHQIIVNKRIINYAEIGSDTLPVAFFVHGSPGSWSAWEGFFKDSSLLQNVKMVAVDRPGFGYSGLGKGLKTLTEQVALFKPIVEKYKLKNRKVILIGHSLGGPLIARMAMDYPHLIDNLIFVAASNSPELEPPNWYRHIGDFILFRYLIPKSFRASNREILYVKPELEKMLPFWRNITQKSIIIQGEKDVLVPYQNANFTKEKLENAEVELIMKPEMNHFVPWSNPELIKNAILKICK